MVIRKAVVRRVLAKGSKTPPNPIRSRVAKTSHPVTPDGRYIVVQGRLWRASNPELDVVTRQQLVTALMLARREIHQAAGDFDRIARARKAVDITKIALGERGPVWWIDGAPDYNRHMAINTPYAKWWQALGPNAEEALPATP